MKAFLWFLSIDIKMITRELYYHHHTSNRNQFRMMCSEAEEQNIVTPTRQLSNGNVMTFGSYTRTGCPNKCGKNWNHTLQLRVFVPKFYLKGIFVIVFSRIITPTRIKPHTRIIAQSKIICRNYAPYSNYGP